MLLLLFFVELGALNEAQKVNKQEATLQQVGAEERRALEKGETDFLPHPGPLLLTSCIISYQLRVDHICAYYASL